jgi:hypothetical protein
MLCDRRWMPPHWSVCREIVEARLECLVERTRNRVCGLISFKRPADLKPRVQGLLPEHQSHYDTKDLRAVTSGLGGSS